MNILEINTNDFRGGAAQVAHNLKEELKRKGHRVSIFCAHKITKDTEVSLINPQMACGFLSAISKRIIKKDLPSFMVFKSRDIFRSLMANDIEFFKIEHILKTEQFKQADIIHLHNLHGNYFNLKLLKEISAIKPVVWTLHDMWGLSGHCSYSYECKRWQSGCGNCPDLNIYPSLAWDNTSGLWKKKKEIYDNSNIHVVLPSKWLQRKTEKSILQKKNIHLIYNGVDLKNLKACDASEARKELNLPLNKKIVMFLASGGKKDVRKGWTYIEKIMAEYKDVLFLCIGGKEDKYDGKANIQYVSYVDSKSLLAKYFSVADVFLFTSLAENFPLVILEALACGVPIVSFDVGGVREAVDHKENGYIAEYKNIDDLKKGIDYIFSLSLEKLEQIRQNSVKKAHGDFSLEIMTKNYIKLYRSLV